MKQAECTIIMYHYVRNMPETEYPGIKGLLVKNFISQLNYLLKNYKFISLDDYIEFLNNDKKIPQKSCILTFDDGFSDHYKNVFPILKEKKIPACFFPITQPLTDFIVPPVHQVHFLLAKIGSKAFARDFNKILKDKFQNIASEFIANNTILKQKKCFWDNIDVLAGNLKYNISIMPQGPRSEILNRIFNKHFQDQKSFCKNLYMNFDQMREMAGVGMSFGNHSHSHLKLTEIGKKERKEEINRAKEILEKEIGAKIRFFSYPYGVYDNETIEILKNEGYSCALTTDFDVNKGRDVNIFALKRLDTNHIPLK